MNVKNNMLSAKMVRVHGMDDARWTKQDKSSQYKGLVNLFKRDRKIAAADTTVTARKQKMQLKALKEDIETSRNRLQGLILGDKQELRNTLAEHKPMQLAYQELPALQVIDHIYQYNFNKRKQLDLLKYRTEQRTQVLIGLKLRKSILEDRMTYPDYNFPLEKRAEIITGKVQDAILKKEAALVVHQAYKNIINIMNRDALYYDAILGDLKKDARSQGQCMIRATQLGQLAMEYLDDRKEEFKELEEAVKRDMKSRLQDLNTVSNEMLQIQEHLRHLIRKDSDINCGKIMLSSEFSNKEISEQVQDVEKVLSNLQSITMVSNFNQIYDCLVEQLRQKERLTELKQKNLETHDTLLNKLNHAQTMRHLMENTMIETTNSYMETKKLISEEMKNQKERKKQIDKKMEVKNKLLAKIKSSLKQLEAICEVIDDGTVKMPSNKDQVMLPIGEPLYRERFPDSGDYDERRIIEQLAPKIQKLMSSAGQIASRVFKDDQTASALMLYGDLAAKQMRIIEFDAVVQDESLIDEASTDIAQVPTREEIKKTSAMLVKQFAIDPDLMPVVKK